MMAARILSCFSSTYCCESTFSALQNIKNKNRNQLVDENLNSAIICAVSCCNLFIFSKIWGAMAPKSYGSGPHV